MIEIIKLQQKKRPKSISMAGSIPMVESIPTPYFTPFWIFGSDSECFFNDYSTTIQGTWIHFQNLGHNMIYIAVESTVTFLGAFLLRLTIENERIRL